MSGPDRLDSWKAIAAYLKRDVRTVRRWEKEQGLPIHRHFHKRLGSVYAYTSELDAWWANESDRIPWAEEAQQAPVDTPPATSPAHVPVAEGRAWLKVAALAVLAVALVSSVFLARRVRATPRPLLAQVTFNTAERPALASAISPDGKYVAYVDSDGVVLHTLANHQDRRIPIAVNAELRDLAWLRDSTNLVLSADSGIWRTSIFGDAVQRIAEIGGLIAISPDDAAIAVTDAQRSRIRVLSIAGEPMGEAAAPEARTRFSRSTWSPDGRRLAFIKNVSKPGKVEASIETRYADGSDRTTVFSGRIHSVIWTPDGRLIFSQPLPPPKARFTTLWQVSVDAATGRALGAPTQITDAPDFTYLTPSITADGRVLAFTVTRRRIDAYVADFDPGRPALDRARRAVLNFPDNLSTGWTPRGDALLFVSSRRGPDGIYRQSLDGSDPRDFVVTPGAVHQAALEPGERWIYYIEDSRPTLMRVRASGGTAEPLFPLGTQPTDSWLECARPPARTCVVSAVTGDRLHLTLFDGVTGQPGVSRDVTAPPSPSSWALSPDGTRVSSVVAGSPAGRLVIVHLPTGTITQRESTAFVNLQTVGWTADGRGWLVNTGAGADGGRVLYVGPTGEPVVVWQSPSQRLWHPIVSPDGRHVAFSSGLSESTVWTIKLVQ